MPQTAHCTFGSLIESANYFKYALDEKTDRIALIFYQTPHMQQFYSKYGQVLFIDGTYKVNRNDYSFYLTVVEDHNANSQVV